MSKKVFLKEQSLAEKDPIFQQAVAAWENMTEQLSGKRKNFAQLPTEQKISITRQFLKPAMKTGYLVHPKTGQKFPILKEAAVRTVVDEFGNETPDTGQSFKKPNPEKIKETQKRLNVIRGIEMGVEAHGLQLPPNTDLNKMSLDQLETLRQSLLKQREQQVNQSATQLTTQGKTQGNVNGENITISSPGNVTATKNKFIPGMLNPQSQQDNVNITQSQQNTVKSEPLVTADDGTSYTKDQMDSMLNKLKEFDNKLKPVSEQKNIAKFLKCLSEKNYSKANKYLKIVVQNKLKNLFLKEI